MYFTTQEDFEALLCWLDSDRDRAGEKYDEIRHSLIKMFAWRHFSNPEDLADVTMNRVLQKAHSLRESYIGDPVRYFYSVARNVAQESQRQIVRQIDIDAIEKVGPDPSFQDDLLEKKFEALHEWLNTLTESERNMLLDYYADEGMAKIQTRKKLGEALGLSSTALRQRIHRLRMDGEKWMRKRLVKEGFSSG